MHKQLQGVLSRAQMGFMCVCVCGMCVKMSLISHAVGYILWIHSFFLFSSLYIPTLVSF